MASLAPSPVPTSTARQSPNPTDAAAPTLTPIASATPAPTQTQRPAPTPNPFKSIEQVIRLVADFPVEFTLGARGDPVQYLYSRAFVATLPLRVTSIAAPDAALVRSHRALIEGLTTEAGRNPRRSPISIAGTVVGLSVSRYSRRITGHVRKIRSYIVTEAEMAEIAEMTRGLDHTAAPPINDSTAEARAILFFASTGTLAVVYGTSIDEGGDFWTDKGIETRFVARGPGRTYFEVVWSAQHGRRTTYGGKSPDVEPAWAAFGCTSSNDYCAKGGGSLRVRTE